MASAVTGGSATRSRPRATRDLNWRNQTWTRENRAGKASALPPNKRNREATMIDNSYYSQDTHGPYELHDIGNLELEEGGAIRGCKLAYATFGKLNAARDNAILIPTWYSGTNKIMEQVYIGKGRALDPDKYFIVVVNQIGSGLSTSPHNTPAPAGMGNFPHVRIGDDVCAQHKL